MALEIGVERLNDRVERIHIVVKIGRTDCFTDMKFFIDRVYRTEAENGIRVFPDQMIDYRNVGGIGFQSSERIIIAIINTQHDYDGIARIRIQNPSELGNGNILKPV